jgi:ribokinase
MIDGAGERTIVTIGDRLQADGDDPLDWDRLATVDGVYFTAGDRLALLRSRSAPVLVASPRAHAAFDGALGSAPGDDGGDRGGDRGGAAPAGPGAPSGPGVAGDPVVDALLYSAHDRQECLWAQEIGSRVRVRVVTEGAHGGRWWGEEEGAWDPAPAPVVHGDSYGCGDSFAAGFTCALAAGATVAQAAALGGLCGAHCLGLHGAP